MRVNGSNRAYNDALASSLITCPSLTRAMAMAMAVAEAAHKPTNSVNQINIQSQKDYNNAFIILIFICQLTQHKPTVHRAPSMHSVVQTMMIVSMRTH